MADQNESGWVEIDEDELDELGVCYCRMARLLVPLARKQLPELFKWLRDAKRGQFSFKGYVEKAA